MDKNYKVIFPKQNVVELVEWEMPEVGDKDMLIKAEISQISTGTELTMLELNVEPNSPWANSITYPVENVGYSMVGKVVAVGKDVDPALVGKRVFTSGRHQMYSVVKADAYEGLAWIPDNVPSEDAVFAVIGCISNGSIRAAEIKPGDACVVYGAGIIGQMVARLAHAAGSTKVFVADISDNRLSKLPDDPCFIPVNSAKVNVPEFVKANTRNNEGAPFVFETTSVGALVEEELKCLAYRGKLIITSSPKTKSVVDFDFCSRKGITIIGAHNHIVHAPVETSHNRWTRRRDMDYILELLSKGQMTVNEMHTHRANYKDAVSMYHMLVKDRTQALSVILEWED